MGPIDINSLWWKKTDEDKRKVIILNMWLSNWMFAEKDHAMVAHFARESRIMLISIDDFTWKTRDEVRELLWWWVLIEENLHPEIEEERGIFISKLMDVSSESFSDKIAWRLMGTIDAEMTAQKLKDIVAFEIKMIKDLEISHNIFERETKSTKSFIKKMNQQYARKNRRK